MKSYEEMSNDVLQCIHAYEAARKLRRAKMTKIVASATLAAAVGIGGAALWSRSSNVFAPNDANLLDSTAAPTESHTDHANADSTSAQESAQSMVTTSTTVTTPSDVATQQTGNVTQQVPIPATEPSGSSDDPVSGSNGWIMFRTSLVWNGVTYYHNDMASSKAYTQDRCIGRVGDFRGEYDDTLHYYIHSDDAVYTVKETQDVLFVVKADGEIVIMSSPQWSPERLAPDDIDANAVQDAAAIEVTNGFCHIFCMINSDGTVGYVAPDCPDAVLAGPKDS